MNSPNAKSNTASVRGNQPAYKLVVTSIGKANAGIVTTLRHILPWPDKQIAALLYQAPSELIRGLPYDVALEMHEMLNTTGLAATVMAEDEPFKAGDDTYELAIIIQDVGQLPAILNDICLILGVNMEMARKLAFSTPAVLLGRVSAATAEAIKQRFESYQVDVIASRTQEACYDLFIGPCSQAIRRIAEQIVRQAGLDLVVQRHDQEKDTPVLAYGLTLQQATQVCEQLQRTAAPFRIVNRGFQTFDILLEEAPHSEATVDFLVSTTAMSESIAQKVINRAPIVIFQNLTSARTQAHLSAISELGGQAVARLLTFQTFNLVIDQIADLPGTIQRLTMPTTMPAARLMKNLSQLPARLDPPFPRVQAQWLQLVLKQIGTKARLILQ